MLSTVATVATATPQSATYLREAHEAHPTNSPVQSIMPNWTGLMVTSDWNSLLIPPKKKARLVTGDWPETYYVYYQ